MTDIVERLRQNHALNNFDICDEAADEIEKLRIELDELSHVRAETQERKKTEEVEAEIEENRKLEAEVFSELKAMVDSEADKRIAALESALNLALMCVEHLREFEDISPNMQFRLAREVYPLLEKKEALIDIKEIANRLCSRIGQYKRYERCPQISSTG